MSCRFYSGKTSNDGNRFNDVDIDVDEADAPPAEVFVSEITSTAWRSRMIASSARVTR